MPALEAYRLVEQPHMKDMWGGIRGVTFAAGLGTGDEGEQKEGKEGIFRGGREEIFWGERIKRCFGEKMALELGPKGLVGAYQTTGVREQPVCRHGDVKP